MYSYDLWKEVAYCNDSCATASIQGTSLQSYIDNLTQRLAEKDEVIAEYERLLQSREDRIVQIEAENSELNAKLDDLSTYNLSDKLFGTENCKYVAVNENRDETEKRKSQEDESMEDRDMDDVISSLEGVVLDTRNSLLYLKQAYCDIDLFDTQEVCGFTEAEMTGNDPVREVYEYPPTKSKPKSNDRLHLFRMSDHLDLLAPFLQRQTQLPLALSSCLAKYREGTSRIEDLISSIHQSKKRRNLWLKHYFSSRAC